MAGRSGAQLQARGRVFARLGGWFEAHPAVQQWLKVLRLGLFQFGMGLSLAPVTGTLNRVLIDELRIPAAAVALLIAIHYFVSPLRAIVGFRSDQRRADGHWRTPGVVLGAMLTFGGLTCAPFALILLSGDGLLSFPLAMMVCFVIFLVYGVGVNMVETMYLAVVSDITPPRDRGRVLAVLWMMLVLGTVVGSFVVGSLLVNYSHYRLIQVMQGSALVFVLLTFLAMIRQERLKSTGQVETLHDEVVVRMSLWDSLRLLARQRMLLALFGVLFLATVAFASHDVLLEPYGGQILGMSVTATTQLTSLWGVAMLVAVAAAGLWLWRGRSAVFLIGVGAVVGALGFGVISYASDAALVQPFRLGVALIGLGRGAFIVGSVALVMSLADRNHAGLFIGLWGVMQSLAQGIGVVGSGIARDVAQSMTGSTLLGYTAVYIAALGCLLLALLLLLVLRLDRRINAGAVRSPWANLQDIPADQLIY